MIKPEDVGTFATMWTIRPVYFQDRRSAASNPTRSEQALLAPREYGGAEGCTRRCIEFGGPPASEAVRLSRKVVDKYEAAQLTCDSFETRGETGPCSLAANSPISSPNQEYTVKPKTAGHWSW